MEGSCESDGNAHEIKEANEESEQNEKQGEIDEKQDVATTPNINVLQEDVKNYIETYLKGQGYDNVNIDVAMGSELGDNFMGFIGKLTINAVDSNNEPKTFKWIVKTAPNQEMSRMMMFASLVYQRETYLYKNVLQIFRDFQREKRVLEPFDQYPGFVLAYEEPMKESIVMEDMKHVGYIMRPRQEPLDLNHVKLVMKAYAKLHAISYALKDQKPDIFKTIAKNTKDTYTDTILTDMAQPVHAPMMQGIFSILDPVKDAKILPHFKKFLDNYVKILLNLLADTNERSVICHGDSWVNNMLWKYDENKSNIPKKVCIIDFQQSRYGSPVCDLSYFLFTCTTKEFRDKHYDDMIKLYYYTLCAHVTELGTDPQKYLPFDALQKELKKYSLVGLFASAFVLFLITRDTQEIPEWRTEDSGPEAVQEEMIKQVQSSQNMVLYLERLRGVLTDFCEKGYFNNIM